MSMFIPTAASLTAARSQFVPLCLCLFLPMPEGTWVISGETMGAGEGAGADNTAAGGDDDDDDAAGVVLLHPRDT